MKKADKTLFCELGYQLFSVLNQILKITIFKKINISQMVLLLHIETVK